MQSLYWMRKQSKFIITKQEVISIMVLYYLCTLLWTHAVHLMRTTKQNEYVVLCSKGGEIRQTKTRVSHITALNVAMIYSMQNLADVSSFSLCVLNLLLRIVVSGSTSATYFGFVARSSNSQLVTHKICSHFATRTFLYLVKQSQSLPHEAFSSMWRQNQPWIRTQKHQELLTILLTNFIWSWWLDIGLFLGKRRWSRSWSLCSSPILLYTEKGENSHNIFRHCYTTQQLQHNRCIALTV